MAIQQGSWLSHSVGSSQNSDWLVKRIFSYCKQIFMDNQTMALAKKCSQLTLNCVASLRNKSVPNVLKYQNYRSIKSGNLLTKRWGKYCFHKCVSVHGDREKRVPLDRTGITFPLPPSSSQDRDIPPFPSCPLPSSRDQGPGRLCGTGGLPLASAQEDFLV